ncbi:hypothetical protein DIPPA_06214 [Diplonema papillatum]|nr:hypothetical protein DIPPA_06214 [Diplonema papillatum]
MKRLWTLRCPNHRACLSRAFSERSTCWEILGIPNGGADITKSDIAASYRQRAKEWHPDCPGGDLKKMKLVNLAFVEAKRKFQERGSGPASGNRDTVNGPRHESLFDTIWALFVEVNRFFKDALNPKSWRVSRAHRGPQQPQEERSTQRSSQKRTSPKDARHEQQREDDRIKMQREDFERAQAARSAEALRRRLRPQDIDASKSSKATQQLASKTDLLAEADALVKQLCIRPPPWLWNNRERQPLEAIARGLRGLSREWYQLNTVDRDDSCPLSPERITWYHKELSTATQHRNKARIDLLLAVLSARGDVDLSAFEAYLDDRKDPEEAAQ